jgi:hypothetical protein
MKLNIELDGVKLGAEANKLYEQKGANEVFEVVLANLVLAKNKEGLKGSDRKTYHRILTKLDAGEAELDLDEAEFDLIKEYFLIADIPILPSSVRLFTFYQQQIEKCLANKG